MQNVQPRLNIIFTAFLFSSLVYLIVGFALTKTGWKPVLTDGSLDQILFAIFLAVSVGLIILIFQMKRGIASESDDNRVGDAIFSKSILFFAFAEIPSILGLVLFLLTGKFLYLVILCIVSILAFVAARPMEKQ